MWQECLITGSQNCHSGYEFTSFSGLWHFNSWWNHKTDI
jgi:hypothetical protein